jgi:hypothetical protein
MANLITNEMIEITNTSYRHSTINEYQEFTPDFRKFIHELSQLEEELFRTDTLTIDHDYGRTIVNRIYFSWLITYMTKKFRSFFVPQTEADQNFLFKLDQEMIPDATIMPQHLLDTLIKTIQCYQLAKTNILRIPMTDPHVQVSSTRYSTATATTYKHVYIPFEFDSIPDPGLLTHLFHLIRNRRILFARKDSMITDAINFLLHSELSETELQVTDGNQTPQSILEQLLFHAFLDNMPDCTPAQLAQSIDNVPLELGPPISRYSEDNPLKVHSSKRTFDTIPPRDWFDAHRATLQRNQIPPPDSKLVGSLPDSKFPFNPLIEKTNVQRDTRLDRNLSHTAKKSTDFWLEVFSTP